MWLLKNAAFQKAGFKKWLNWTEDRKKNSSLNIAVDGDADNLVWVENYKQENKMPSSWNLLSSLRAGNLGPK